MKTYKINITFIFKDEDSEIEEKGMDRFRKEFFDTFGDTDQVEDLKLDAIEIE